MNEDLQTYAVQKKIQKSENPNPLNHISFFLSLLEKTFNPFWTLKIEKENLLLHSIHDDWFGWSTFLSLNAVNQTGSLFFREGWNFLFCEKSRSLWIFMTIPSQFIFEFLFMNYIFKSLAKSLKYGRHYWSELAMKFSVLSPRKFFSFSPILKWNTRVLSSAFLKHEMLP